VNLASSVSRRFGLDRTLLLLAKQNADKPVVGASLTQRLEMMEVIAQAEPAGSMFCGVTAHPLFVDKAAALRALCGPDSRLLFIVGYDTWIRITDPKYYPAGGLDSALRQIFEAVEVVVASRDASSASNLTPLSPEEQEAAVCALPEEVTNRRLHFLHNEPELAPLSSSALRTALAAGNTRTVHAILPDCLLDFVERKQLYKD